MYPHSRRRGPIEIHFDILTSCLEPRKATDVLRHANLQHGNLNKYFYHLVKAGFIEQEMFGRRPIYQTSEIGIDLIKEIASISKKLNMDGFELPRKYYYITKEV